MGPRRHAAPSISNDKDFWHPEQAMQSEPLRISLRNDVTVAVPANLESITTYVLLEQEAWFEKELSFLCQWLKPGMTAIDVGANLGVYTLPLERLVRPYGQVFAFEPGCTARKLLEQSRTINVASNLEVFDVALSDNERDGRLSLGNSSELNALSDGDEGEPVHITSLDIEDSRRGWPSPDFIKIDAEGEEDRILVGGQSFFARHSPLVMFEIKAGTKINEHLRAAFPAMGYQLFRLLAGAPILVPAGPELPLDPFELNLFACKSGQIESLRDKELLVDQSLPWHPSAGAISNGLSVLRGQAFAPMFGRLLDDGKYIDRHYAEALAAFAVWRTSSLPARTRCAALFFGYRTLATLCNHAPTTARYATFARLAWEGGWRAESVAALRQIAAHIQRIPFQPTEPCWPPSPLFDNVAVSNPALWFATAVVEQLERTQSYSTYFSGMSPWLEWLCDQPAVSHEMHRRKTLLAARGGLAPLVPSCLQKQAPDHLNWDAWRSGLVPGTRVA
jgi:FkbM family methyltransferase